MFEDVKQTVWKSPVSLVSHTHTCGGSDHLNVCVFEEVSLDLEFCGFYGFKFLRSLEDVQTSGLC